MSDSLKQELQSLRIDPEKKGGGARRVPARVWKILFGIVVIVAVVSVALGMRPEPVATARVMTVEVKEAPTVLVAGGYVVAHHKIQLGSKVTGRVVWIGVEKGDRVRRGQVLVRLDDREYRAQVEQARGALQAAEARRAQAQTGSRPEEIQQARARLEEAEANLRNAKIALDRAQGLAGQGVVAREALDNARAQYDMAVAQVAAWQKNYELVKQGPRREEIDNARATAEQYRGALAFAETQLDATQIRSPIDGTILERLVENGEMVTTMFVGERGAKSSVVSLADLNDLQVELDISQNDFARVAMGQKCTVVPDAYPDRKYEGRVAEIAPEANRQKATVQVKVRVEKPDEYLRPEMNARVSFHDPKGGQVVAREIRVPRTAVFQAEGKSLVFVVENSHAVQRPVETGTETAGAIRVDAGLSGNETIVVRDPARLKNGQRVRTE